LAAASSAPCSSAVGTVEKAEELVELGGDGGAWCLDAGGQLETGHGVDGDLLVPLYPLVSAAEDGSCVVHPATGQTS
jgi:hypothetical protein